MKIHIFIFILLSVTLSAVAQIVLKTGMSSMPIENAIRRGLFSGVVWQITTSPWIIGGLGLYFIGTMVWLLVLSKVDVSLAYPFVGLGFILTMLFGYLILGESVSLMRALGTLLVAIGVVMISQT